MSTIYSQVLVSKADGFEADKVIDKFITEECDQVFMQYLSLTGSTTKVAIDLGPVTTAVFLYITSDQAIQVYKNNSMESWDAKEVFMVIGCEITALHILATEDSEVFIYAAGA